MPRLIDVAVPVPLFQTFTYAVPEEFRDQVQIGCRVVVPFGRRSLTGVVVDEPVDTDLQRVREIRDLLDTEPLFTPQMLEFAEWIARYYVSPIGETFRTMLPQGMSSVSQQVITLEQVPTREELIDLRRTAPRQAALLSALSDHPDGVKLSFLQKKVGAESLHSQLLALEEKGWISRGISEARDVGPKRVRGVRLRPDLLDDEERLTQLFDELDRSAPKQSQVLTLLYARSEREGTGAVPAADLLRDARASSSVLSGLEQKGAIEIVDIQVSREALLKELLDEEVGILDVDEKSIVSNPAQRAVLEQVGDALGKGFATFLLHGVTGSGKTHVYIEAIRKVVAAGKRGILLVPEIALTVQLLDRFRSVFDDRIVLLHSRMSEGERYDGWKRAAAGECDLVIGPRSALFAPVPDLGIIIVDEEHESSYKQYDAQPRYHARDAAVVRGSIEGAVVLLGSATPSIESYYNAQTGKYRLLELPDRVDGAREPKMRLVDTKTLRKQNLMRGSLSTIMIADIRERIARSEGIILFQNRRGFASRLECTNCAHSPMCPNCAVTLTYHKGVDRLKCHYCGYDRKREKSCEVCGAHDLREPGVGTQRVEEDLAEQIPEARVRRMDLDTTSRKGSHRGMLAEFGRGEIDILLGTQMVAKGLDFPRVSLVGVVSADTQLMLPDFRSGERTFQLITQVAGRAGRRSDVPGEVIVQTGNPDHPAIEAAFARDYRDMYSDELSARRELNYPPFSRFIIVEFRSKDQKEAEQHARQFRQLLPTENSAFELLGPTAALLWKLRGWYRYQLIIKNLKGADPGGRIFFAIFRRAYDAYQKNHASRNVELIVDVDAQSLM